jgi:hypothetical protein
VKALTQNKIQILIVDEVRDEPTCGSVKCFLLFGLADAIGRVRLPMSDRLLARQT